MQFYGSGSALSLCLNVVSGRCLRQPIHERMHWHEQQTAWCNHNTVQRWAENILDDMKRVRVTMIEMGEDVQRSASCRVGLVKSTYKEISVNALKKDAVFKAYAETTTRLIFLDVDLLIRPKDEDQDHAKAAIAALDQLVCLLLTRPANKCPCSVVWNTFSTGSCFSRHFADDCEKGSIVCFALEQA